MIPKNLHKITPELKLHFTGKKVINDFSYDMINITIL